jgi:hypothetical protein
VSLDRDALIALIVRDSEHESWSAETFADRILALDDAARRVMVVHSEEEFRSRVQAELRAEAAEARLANIAALRDEMQAQPGGSVVWIDDLDEILDGASPGAALTPEEAHAVALVLRQCTVPGDSNRAENRRLALAARLEAQQ